MRVHNDSEKDLLSKLKLGDEPAFSKIYQLHVKIIYAFVLKILKSPALTEDVVQEVFIRLWENARSVDTNTTIRPYLFTIARNLSLNVIRKAGREEWITEEIANHVYDQSRDGYSYTQHKQTKAFIDDAISRLPPKRKEIYELCHGEGYSYQQAADKLGVKNSTVNSQMVKAIKSIKDYLIKNGVLVAILLLK